VPLRALTRDDLRNAGRGEAAYTRLREAINQRRLLPGDRVTEAALADKLGVSRTPVREAIRRLIAEGLLSVGPSRGLIVTELSREQVMQLYDLREVLEGAAAGLAARHAHEAEIAGIRRRLSEMERMESAEELAAANRELHRAIYAAAHNQYLIQAANNLADSLNLLPGTTFSVPDRPRTAHAEHVEIVRAIESGDFARAEETGRRHIHEAQAHRLRMLFGGR